MISFLLFVIYLEVVLSVYMQSVAKHVPHN